MGANLSGRVSDKEGLVQPRLGDLPESCVAMVLMNMDPPEICKLARLNRAFRGASSADFIWESKLPPNYRFIVDRVFDETTKLNISGKRDIYARLCRSKSFDGGTKVTLLVYTAFVFPLSLGRFILHLSKFSLFNLGAFLVL